MRETNNNSSEGHSRRTFMKATGAATAATTVGLTAQGVAADEHTVGAMLNDMSIAEKAGQMIQPVVNSLDPEADSTFQDVSEIGDLISEVAAGSLLSGGSLPPTTDPQELVEKVNALQEYMIDNSPHGIPFFYGVDAVHGACYLDGATVFPNRLNMGATRDPETIERAERHTAAVLEATSCHETFAPTIELQRDPRWGRFFEGISEDPKVLSDISAARTRALESNDRVTSTVKHFAGYEVPHNGNDRAAANVSMRDLRETLLPPFEVAIAEGPGMVMVNSGSVNGIPAHASRWLLTDVLREEYDFDGVVISDWNDLFRMIDRHQYFPDTEDGRRSAVEAAIEAGLDMVMLGGGGLTPPEFIAHVQTLVSNGDLSEKRIDQSVRRILQLKRSLGLFENPYADSSNLASLVGNDESMEVATDLARESMVLLKNDPVTEGGPSALPLSGTENVLVTGPGIDPETGIENRILMQYGGWTLGWQGIEGGSLTDGGPRPTGTTMVAELENALGRGQLTHVPTNFDRSQWWSIPEDSTNENGEYGFTDEQRSAVESAAPDADVAVVVLGEGPHNEGFGDRDTLRLPETQREILQTVVENTSDDTTIVGVEYAGSPRGNDETFQHLDALLFAGEPGSGGGKAVVETLLGENNPSGRLGFTWPKQVGHVPNYHNAWPSSRHEPLYPYGHGLSYTDFEYSDLSVSPSNVGNPRAGRTVTVTVDVTNTGDVAGDHVVEVFNTEFYGSVITRDRRVVGYERVHLDSGERKTVEVEVDMEALEVVPGDVPALGPKAVEAGEYELTVGTNSDMTSTLTVRTTCGVGRVRHLPGRFDADGDGEVTVSDVLEIYRLSKGE
ncbi:glycoside hydrolase family 3 N-terminal domain-containing protein [Haladaptatus sp. T7]|uniref:glycoside hydrolase family 3 protein n=1 Tax=Haladaptatus sp. T7 TaxID=2029368 RepID=UPI002232C382|nr:glycoside hydrolase family 3 N-terminal domain-containing protein [Haladaptatus sp. T7]